LFVVPLSTGETLFSGIVIVWCLMSVERVPSSLTASACARPRFSPGEGIDKDLGPLSCSLVPEPLSGLVSLFHATVS